MKILALAFAFAAFICQIEFGQLQVTFPENTVATTTTRATTITTTATKPSSTASSNSTSKITSSSTVQSSSSTTKAVSTSVSGSSTLASNSSTTATSTRSGNSTASSMTTTKSNSSSSAVNATSTKPASITPATNATTTKQINVTTTLKTNVSTTTKTTSGIQSSTISKTTVKTNSNGTTTTRRSVNGQDSTNEGESTAEQEETTTEEEYPTTEEQTTAEEEHSTTEEESSTEFESSTESENEKSPGSTSTSAKTTTVPTKPTATGTSSTSRPSTMSQGTTVTRSECVTCRNSTSTNSTTPSSMTGTPRPSEQPGMSSTTTTSPNPNGSTRRPRPTSKPRGNQTCGICATTGYCEIAGGRSSTDGSGKIDVRGSADSDKTMTTKRRVKIENKGSEPITSGTSSKMTYPALTGVGEANATQTQCDDKRLELCQVPRGVVQCGLRFPPVEGSPVVTSPRANYGAYPWQGIVFKCDNYWASGALIDSMHFITVAHKFFNLTSNVTHFKVRLGDWDLRRDKEPLPFQEYQIRSITIHPKYNPTTQANDIAIITFTKNVTLGQVPTIAAGCLPAKPISGIRCWLSGWARKAKDESKHDNDSKHEENKSTHENGTKHHDKGMKYGPQFEVDLPVIDGPACETLLRKTLLGPKFVLDQKSFMCAGGEPGKDASDGDSGSPLVCEVNRQFYITGLVAWGIDYGKRGVPGVYVNVNNYIPWIQSITQPPCRDVKAKP